MGDVNSCDCYVAAPSRAKYLQEARLKAAKEAQASMSGLQQAYDRAKKSAEEASAKLGKALKVEAEAKRAVEREKQREMLKGIKEKAKEDKEKQKQVGDMIDVVLLGCSWATPPAACVWYCLLMSGLWLG